MRISDWSSDVCSSDLLGREYPYKMDLVLTGPEDAKPPRQHHPIFHGSFDWHSCVHGWWQILRLARRFPDLPIAAQIRARAGEMLVPEKVAGERAFLRSEEHTSELQSLLRNSYAVLCLKKKHKSLHYKQH